MSDKHSVQFALLRNFRVFASIRQKIPLFLPSVVIRGKARVYALYHFLCRSLSPGRGKRTKDGKKPYGFKR